MADDYVRETLRTLRERTGDSYVPLSEVVAAIQRRVDDCLANADRALTDVVEHSYRCEAGRMRETIREIERRWGPGPRCERCGGKGYWGGDGIKTACVVCDCEAARGPQAELDSPNFTPQELRDFEAGSYERRNRRG